MLNDASLIEEAYKRGFGNASRIVPGHLVDSGIMMDIPKGAYFYVNPSSGDLYFKATTGETNFVSVDEKDKTLWAGVIYYKLRRSWAKIITERHLTVEEMKKKLEELSEFPSEGVCWQPTKELRDYFVKNFDQVSPSILTSKGVAWNRLSVWSVSGSSGKPEYTMEQLEPFIQRDMVRQTPPPHIGQNPMTPDECFLPEKWYIMIDKNNVYDVQCFLISKKDEYIGYSSTWNPSPGGSLLYPQHSSRAYGITGRPLEPGYTEITTEQFKNHVLREEEYVPFSVRNDYRLPDKWCIHNNPLNYEMIDAFMYKHRSEWNGHVNIWSTEGSHTYFHYPPVSKEPCHSHSSPQPGYTLITTQQFKKHVLTHTEKNQFTNNLNLEEDGKSTEFRGSRESNKGESCKVQRPHLSIRGGSEIRATSIGCSKIQIKVGNGYSADNL